MKRGWWNVLIVVGCVAAGATLGYWYGKATMTPSDEIAWGIKPLLSAYAGAGIGLVISLIAIARLRGRSRDNDV